MPGLFNYTDLLCMSSAIQSDCIIEKSISEHQAHSSNYSKAYNVL